jgi:hypothetical protein
MTVDAPDAAMRSDMKPCLVLGFHDVTGRAEERRFGKRHKLWWPESQEDPGSSNNDHQQNQDLPVDHPEKFHPPPRQTVTPGAWHMRRSLPARNPFESNEMADDEREE